MLIVWFILLKNLNIVFHSAFTSSCPLKTSKRPTFAYDECLLLKNGCWSHLFFYFLFLNFLTKLCSSLYFSPIVYQAFLPCSRLTFYTFDCFFTVGSNLYFNRPICVFFIPLSALLLLLLKFIFGQLWFLHYMAPLYTSIFKTTYAQFELFSMIFP